MLTDAFSHHAVLDFIAGIRAFDRHGDIQELFTDGYCYWFAFLLEGRFPGAQMMYEPVEGHFVTAYQGRIYDIRGDVTDLYDRKEFYSEEYCLEIPSIVNGCMMKTAERE